MSAERLPNVDLVFWRLPSSADKPTVGTVRTLLEASSLRPERAADIPAPTAFRRACEAMRDQHTLVRPFKAKKADEATLLAQIDREMVEDGELRRERVGVYQLSEDGDMPTVLSINGSSLDALFSLREAFDGARFAYAGSDLSATIKAILDMDGLGAYSVRPGVYFVPRNPDALDLLDRLERFCNSVGVRLLRYSSDTEAHRAEAQDAIAAGLGADVDAHEQAIATYTPEVRQGIIDNRREAMAGTERMIGRLELFLQGSATGLRQRLDNLRTLLDQVERNASAQRDAARVAGRRQIVGIQGGAQ